MRFLIISLETPGFYCLEESGGIENIIKVPSNRKFFF